MVKESQSRGSSTFFCPAFKKNVSNAFLKHLTSQSDQPHDPDPLLLISPNILQIPSFLSDLFRFLQTPEAAPAQ